MSDNCDEIRHDFVEKRRNSIGGSDAAAILGLNPYVSPHRVWSEKLGLAKPIPDNEAMRQGRDLEDYVARRFIEETGISVDFADQFAVNPAYPFAHANIDRKVVGENAGLECKTTSALNLKKFDNGEYPDQYYVQCVHYMAVTGASHWYLAVLVYGRGFFVYKIERNQREIDKLMEAEERFWEGYVVTRLPPPADGSDDATESISEAYTESVDVTVPLIDREHTLGEWIDLSRQKAAIERRMEEIKQTLMIDLGDAESGRCDRYKVDWKPQTRTTIDWRAFAESNPDIDLSPYEKKTKFRKFTVKEVKTRV